MWNMRDPTAADVQYFRNLYHPLLTLDHGVRRKDGTVEALQMLDGMIINVVDKSRIGVKLGGGSVVMRYKISLRKRKD